MSILVIWEKKVQDKENEFYDDQRHETSTNPFLYIDCIREVMCYLAQYSLFSHCIINWCVRSFPSFFIFLWSEPSINFSMHVFSNKMHLYGFTSCRSTTFISFHFIKYRTILFNITRERNVCQFPRRRRSNDNCIFVLCLYIYERCNFMNTVYRKWRRELGIKPV